MQILQRSPNKMLRTESNRKLSPRRIGTKPPIDADGLMKGVDELFQLTRKTRKVVRKEKRYSVKTKKEESKEFTHNLQQTP
jgi:hypothetical protein